MIGVIDKRVVADALLSYVASYAHEKGEPFPPLTPDVEADALVREDPFAFLLAVIFDQGIPYERAWSAPIELRRRLGAIRHPPCEPGGSESRRQAAAGAPPIRGEHAEMARLRG